MNRRGKTSIAAMLLALLVFAFAFSVHAAGDSRAVDRTVDFKISGEMRVTPDRVEIKQGQKVRLVLKNDSRVPLEFALGTEDGVIEHAAQMLKFPDMTHDQAYVVRLAPGTTDEMVWTFDRAGDFELACLIAGHYQSGMVGKIKVVSVVGAKGDGPANRKP